MKLDRGRTVFVVCAVISMMSISFAPDALASGGDLDPTFGSEGWLELDVFRDPEGPEL